TRDQAEAELLALHDLVKARKIDSGGHSADAIYLDAIEIYREAGVTDKLTQLIDDFIKAYPKHSRVPGFLLYLANNYRETQDQEKYEYYARELFLKDKTQAGPYQSIAGGKLAAIFAQFDAAYKIKDWKTAFQKRDDFKKLEAVYKKDKLQLDTAIAYNDFAIAEAEYNELQAKTAYLAEFERTLRAIEQGDLLNTSAAEAIQITKLTSWEGHLFGGVNRIPILTQRTKAEYEKITNLLRRPQNKYLTTSQRMRALDLISRLNDHAAEIIEIRVGKYLVTSREVLEYKTLYNPDRYDAMVAGIAKQASDYAEKNHRSISNGIYRDIYTNFVLAGYADNHTQRAIQQLQASQLLPEYQLAPYPLDPDWVLSLRQAGPVGKDESRFSASTSTIGYRLGSFQIPAGDTLTIQRQFDLKLIPEFSYLHFAFGSNPTAYINNVRVALEYVQVDSVAGRDGFAQHYAARIAGKPWKEVGNILRVEFSNLSGREEQLHFGIELIYDAEKFRQSLPTQTLIIASNPEWKAYRIDPETGAETPVPTVPATAFTLPLKASADWESYGAQAIWIPETESTPAAQVAFGLDFALESDFRSALLEYVAPETSSVYLNGKPILENYFYDYDTVPFQAYTKQLTLPREFLRQGPNQLRIVSQNASFFRGMQAALAITQTVRE
ncbi:MAG TPA: hypothetical protein PKH19_04115, partial [Candidatus Syntrophosphaera sp.]|nr:hypothetical protein [Candidatus Syntrophosphaera sp.]